MDRTLEQKFTVDSLLNFLKTFKNEFSDFELPVISELIARITYVHEAGNLGQEDIDKLATILKPLVDSKPTLDALVSEYRETKEALAQINSKLESLGNKISLQNPRIVDSLLEEFLEKTEYGAKTIYVILQNEGLFTKVLKEKIEIELLDDEELLSIFDQAKSEVGEGDEDILRLKIVTLISSRLQSKFQARSQDISEMKKALEEPTTFLESGKQKIKQIIDDIPIDAILNLLNGSDAEDQWTNLTKKDGTFTKLEEICGGLKTIANDTNNTEIFSSLERIVELASDIREKDGKDIKDLITKLTDLFDEIVKLENSDNFESLSGSSDILSAKELIIKFINAFEKLPGVEEDLLDGLNLILKNPSLNTILVQLLDSESKNLNSFIQNYKEAPFEDKIRIIREIKFALSTAESNFDLYLGHYKKQWEEVFTAMQQRLVAQFSSESETVANLTKNAINAGNEKELNRQKEEMTAKRDTNREQINQELSRFQNLVDSINNALQLNILRTNIQTINIHKAELEKINNQILPVLRSYREELDFIEQVEMPKLDEVLKSVYTYLDYFKNLKNFNSFEIQEPINLLNYLRDRILGEIKRRTADVEKPVVGGMEGIIATAKALSADDLVKLIERLQALKAAKSRETVLTTDQKPKLTEIELEVSKLIEEMRIVENPLINYVITKEDLINKALVIPVQQADRRIDIGQFNMQNESIAFTRVSGYIAYSPRFVPIEGEARFLSKDNESCQMTEGSAITFGNERKIGYFVHNGDLIFFPSTLGFMSKAMPLIKDPLKREIFASKLKKYYKTSAS